MFSKPEVFVTWYYDAGNCAAAFINSELIVFSWNIFKIQQFKTERGEPGVFRSEVELKRFNDWLCLHVCV